MNDIGSIIVAAIIATVIAFTFGWFAGESMRGDVRRAHVTHGTLIDCAKIEALKKALRCPNAD